jgi:hypothetical protein
MWKKQWSALTLTTCAVLLSGTVQAQSSESGVCARTRAEVRAECDSFKKNFKWDEETGQWVLKAGAKPPEGIKSREEIRAERDSFMRGNRWDEVLGRWEPIKGPPRDIGKLSRAEMRKEAQAFMRTHHFDEETGSYLENAPARPKSK